MPSGTVKWFDPKKGYGFIVGEQGQDVFVHYTSIGGEGFRALKDGETVEYELVEGEKGFQARNVQRAEKADKPAEAPAEAEAPEAEEAAEPAEAPEAEEAAEPVEAPEPEQAGDEDEQAQA